MNIGSCHFTEQKDGKDRLSSTWAPTSHLSLHSRRATVNSNSPASSSLLSQTPASPRRQSGADGPRWLRTLLAVGGLQCGNHKPSPLPGP